ncbi:MAG: Rab family GTPase [Candidatus Thorarchaeota archaeon]
MEELSFKVIMIGPPAVGKSSLIRRFIEDKFTLAYKFTIGVDFSTKIIEYDSDKKARVTIWDIGGQDRFKILRRNFYIGTHGALVVFDLTRAQTFSKMKDWVSDMNQLLEVKIPVVILGNKLDLISETGEVIDRNEPKDYADRIGSIYIETSAKSGENVQKAFVDLIKLIIENSLKEI